MFNNKIMTELSEKVFTAKTALMNALGDNSQKYLNNMKFWFRQKWSKEEFDIEARKLLTSDKVHLHNQFLLAILNKIDAFQPSSTLYTNTAGNTNNTGTNRGSSGSSSSSKKRKRSTRYYTDRVTFEPYDICEFLTEDSMEFIRAPNSSNDYNPQPIPPQRYCVQELFLPDSGFIMGRLLVGAWENGLVNVDDIVAEYVSMAVQVLLKNILSSIIMKRQHYRVNSEGKYFYDVGQSIKDPFLKNTLRHKIDDAPLELDKEITSAHLMRRNNDDVAFLSSCEELYPLKRNIITVRDVYKALKDHNVIPSHSVYSINMERITQMLH